MWHVKLPEQDFGFHPDVKGAIEDLYRVVIEAPCSIPSCPSDIKYALIGTALGFIISAGFLALKICMIRKHLFDNDSSDLRSMNAGSSGKGRVVFKPGSAPARDNPCPGQSPSLRP